MVASELLQATLHGAMATVPDDYEIGRPRDHELAELEVIELAAAAIFPPEDLVAGEAGLPLSFFEERAHAGRLWVVRTHTHTHTGTRTQAPSVPVGFAVVTLLDGCPHLYELDVLPEHGRRGLGRALVLHVAGWAAAAGFAAITLTTFRHLAWNAPFYASVGFSEIAEPELSSGMRATLAKEVENGLDPRKRVAMKLALPVVSGSRGERVGS